MRKVIIFVLLMLAVFPATSMAAGQYAKITCFPVTGGNVGATTSITVERTVANSGTWSAIFGPAAPTTPPQSWIDTTRVAGTSYQYRCMFIGSGGQTPSDPTAAVTFIDNVGVPGKGTIDMTIITQ